MLPETSNLDELGKERSWEWIIAHGVCNGAVCVSVLHDGCHVPIHNNVFVTSDNLQLVLQHTAYYSGSTGAVLPLA